MTSTTPAQNPEITIRRRADPAPVTLVLRPVADVPRSMASEIHLRRTRGALRGDVPRLARRRRRVALLPLAARRRASRPRAGHGCLPRTVAAGDRGRAGEPRHRLVRHPPAGRVEMGLEALKLALEQLVPSLGEPVAVQRDLRHTVAAGQEWTIPGYMDLETRGETLTGEAIERVVDLKVKGSTLTNAAGRDPQAGLYLESALCQLGRPGRQSRPARILRRSSCSATEAHVWP